MASGDLFRAFTVRFSFKKKQHVRMLQKFEDKKPNDGKSKNQIVMDALEVYYDVLEKKNQSGMQTELTPDYLEKRLSDMEESIRVKMLQEIVGIVLGSAISGQRSVLLSSYGKPKTMETLDDDETADISSMPEVMGKIMDWSDS